MEFRGIPWKSVEFRGIPWNPLEVRVILSGIPFESRELFTPILMFLVRIVVAMAAKHRDFLRKPKNCIFFQCFGFPKILGLIEMRDENNFHFAIVTFYPLQNGKANFPIRRFGFERP